MSDSLPTIDSVAAAAQDGDEAAFEQIVRVMTPVVVRFFRQRGARDPEELTQKTWLRVVRHLARYDASRSFKTWLFVIAYRIWLDELRARKRLREVSGPLPSILEAHDDRLAERIDALVECTRKLSADQWQIVSLRFWDGLALEQVAERLGIPYGSAKNKAYRAIAQLRKCMEIKGIVLPQKNTERHDDSGVYDKGDPNVCD